jgi:hypothetical protein
MANGIQATADGSKVLLAGPLTTINGTSVTGGIAVRYGTSAASRRTRSVGSRAAAASVGESTGTTSATTACGATPAMCAPTYVYQWDAVGLAAPSNPTCCGATRATASGGAGAGPTGMSTTAPTGQHGFRRLAHRRAGRAERDDAATVLDLPPQRRLPAPVCSRVGLTDGAVAPRGRLGGACSSAVTSPSPVPGTSSSRASPCSAAPPMGRSDRPLDGPFARRMVRPPGWWATLRPPPGGVHDGDGDRPGGKALPRWLLDPRRVGESSLRWVPQ